VLEIVEREANGGAGAFWLVSANAQCWSSSIQPAGQMHGLLPCSCCWLDRLWHNVTTRSTLPRLSSVPTVRGMCQQPTLICILCIASATWSAAVYVEKWWPALVQMSISMSCMPLLISSPPPLLPLSVIFICSVCTHIMHPRITVQETLHPWVSCVLFRARSLVEIEFVLLRWLQSNK
jgi:hypothetical protein